MHCRMSAVCKMVLVTEALKDLKGIFVVVVVVVLPHLQSCTVVGQ